MHRKSQPHDNESVVAEHRISRAGFVIRATSFSKGDTAMGDVTMWVLIGVAVLLILIVIGHYNGPVHPEDETQNARPQLHVQHKTPDDTNPTLVVTVKC